MLILKTVHVFWCCSNWELLCKLSQCRCSLWLLLCRGLFSAVALLLEPVYCYFHLNSKQIFYALFIFSFIHFAFSSVLFSSIYGCYISSAVCVCWCYRVVLSICCWVYCGKWCCVVKRFGKGKKYRQSMKGREQIIWQLLVGFAGEWR